MTSGNFGIIGLCLAILAPLMLIMGRLNHHEGAGVVWAVLLLFAAWLAFRVGHKRSLMERQEQAMWVSRRNFISHD